MRVLAHIHTLNDEGVIEQALDALRRQTRPPDAVVIVDNASTDGTLARTFPERVAVIRNPTNLGTSGAVRAGFAYALEHAFDWIWVFDADSVPEPGVLENLLGFFGRLPAAAQEQVCFLACRAVGASGEYKGQPILFTPSGIKILPLAADAGYSRCDCILWSGSLYRMAAVAKIGLPSADYVLDVAELEYGYRARQLGFTSYTVHSSVIHHDVGRDPGTTRTRRFELPLYEVPPIRCYYTCRNLFYFALYDFPEGRFGLLRSMGWRMLLLPLSFLLEPRKRGKQMRACWRGIWHGATGNILARY